MPRIENEVAVVEVKTLAAEITSFYDKEKNIEHMWQGDPQFWAGRNPILFPMANPTPEIMPDLAKKAGAAVVGTGRSDFPNQINNVLAFPGIFRGTFDVRASDINDAMKIAAAQALANLTSSAQITSCPTPLTMLCVPPWLTPWQRPPRPAAWLASEFLIPL